MRSVFKKALALFCMMALVLGTMVSPAQIFAEDSSSVLAQTASVADSTETASSSTASSEHETETAGASSGSEGAGTQTSSSSEPAGSSTEANEQAASSTIGGSSLEGSNSSASAAVAAAAATGSGINLAGSYSDSDGTTKNYITDYQLSYQNGNDWVTIAQSDITTTVSMYTKLQLKVYFGGVSAQTLLNNGGVMYLDVPALLTNPTVTSGIVTDSTGTQAGTITVSGQRITLQIDTTYLQNKLNTEGTDYTLENGSLTFTATPDPEIVRKNYTQTIKVGPLDVTIRFDPDSDAQSGTLTLAKSSPVYTTDSAGNAYLSFTLTVTAGDALMPSVTVVDQFTANASDVDSYVGVTEEAFTLDSTASTAKPYETVDKGASTSHGSVKLSAAKTDTNPGTMLWTIGDMAAGEVRTLHYMVKLSSDYVGTASASSGVITNTATPYSKTYAHNAATSSFTPNTGATVIKKAGSVIENADSTVTIPYTIVVTADKRNTWTLKNLKVSDYLGTENTTIERTTLWDAITATDSMKNLGFGDFKMSDGTKTISVSEGTGTSTAPYYVIKGKNESPGFNFYLGDLAPGETRTITVNLTMKPVFSSSAITLGNRASVYTNDKSVLGNKGLAESSTKTIFDMQHWDRKIVGSATTEDVEQSVSGDVYSYSGSSWSLASSSAAMTIPSGSYEYQIVVNEQGKWNISSASFKDALSYNGTYLKYAGYLKLEYFKNGVDSSVSSGTDASVIGTLKKKTADKTVWLDINGLASFNFSPKMLGSEFGKGAYLLTYYAAPVSGSFSKVVVGNSFTLSGNIIGTGGTIYVLPAMTVKADVSVTGTEDYTAHKYGWYYDSSDTGDGFTNGKLYWVITVNGTKVSKGVQLRDVPGKVANRTKNTSIAGVYFGNSRTDWSSFTDSYVNYAAMESDSAFTAVDAANYSWSSESNGPGTLTFSQDIRIPDGKTMYVVLMTEPSAKPNSDARTQTVFNNSLQERSNSSMTHNTVNTATIYSLGQGTNFKEFGEYGTYNASTKTWSDVLTKDQNHRISRILTSYTTASGQETLESGTYVDYLLAVNYAGDESGTLKVEDVVPDGMEPVYVRYFWIPQGLRSAANTPTMPELDSGTLGAGSWSDIGVKNTAIDNGGYTGTASAYYDKSGGKIIFHVGNLQKGTAGQIDQKDLQIQIVMRVTDPETIMGKEKEFTNTMNVYTTNSTLVSTSRVTTSVKTHSVDKSKGAVSNGSVPFTVTVNPLGEDLLKDSDTLTLVDELSYGTADNSHGAMTLDPSSVRITDRSGAELPRSQWTLSLAKDTENGKTVMTLVIPDSEQLTIIYTASIDAPPGTFVTYYNSAHWYGYSEDRYNTVQNSVSYNVDASFGFGNNPVISLTKADQDNVTKSLSGAKFAIYKAVYSDGAWKATGDSIETATTGSNGTLTFGSGTTKLQYNTVYAVVETEAPAGYVTDTTPTFIAMARADKSGNYPNESAEWNSTVDSNLVTHTASDLSTWADQGVTVNYRGSTYTYTAYNQKAKLSVSKVFVDKDGNTLSTPPDGTFSFGLYNAAGSLVETLAVTYSGGTASYQLTESGSTKSIDSPVFEDLNVGDSYSVYELDGNGDPVKNGRILYNADGNGYTVAYQNDQTNVNPNTIVVADSKTGTKVTITNQEYTIPDTGIQSFHNFWYIGVFLILAGIMIGYLWLYKRKLAGDQRRK